MTGIIVTGDPKYSATAHWLGFVAIVAASLNVVAGYLITDRMLRMFRKRDTK